MLLPSAIASPGGASCFSAVPIPTGGVATGTVGDPAVGWQPDDWYYNFGGSLAGYVLQPAVGGDGTVRVQTNLADADLFIWDSSCSVVICASTAGSVAPDTCFDGGDVRIQVHYYASIDSRTDYTLLAI
ncbi:MAG: hypothetical protein QOE90_477 [Thermoplasmata archaeon]|nr:hypothetical protein [Thermoplasmata archaeon]